MFNNNKTNSKVLDFESVRNTPLLNNMDKTDHAELMKIAHIREYSAGERVFSEGTLGICFYYIIKGSVDIVGDDNVNTNVLRTYNENAFFSEVHLFSEHTHTVSCIAKELTKLLVISKPDFEELIRLKPKTASKLLLNFLEFFSSQLDKLYKENKLIMEKMSGK